MPAVSLDAGAAEDGRPEGNADELHDTIREDLARLRGEEGEALELGKRSEVIKRLVDAQASLAKSTGAGALTVTRILASSAWAEMLDAIVEALGPWPVAVWALRRTVEALDSGPETAEGRSKRLAMIRACFTGDLAREARRVANQRAEVRGASADELNVLDHPKFKAAVQAITTALAPHPAALRDVCAAIEAASE